MPGATPFVGASRAEIDAQNAAIHAQTAATKPVQMVPYKPEPGQQFYVRELDGLWTLRTMNEIMKDLQPGKWEKGDSGYPYFIREEKKK